MLPEALIIVPLYAIFAGAGLLNSHWGLVLADTAFVMTSLLRGVVEHGTAVKAMALNWPVAGKTGTTDDFSDAWFIGFDPDITLGVWVGYDQKKPLGSGMTGAEAALPIWILICSAVGSPMSRL